MADVAACQIMCFQWIAADIQTRFHCRDAIIDNQADWDFSQSHPNHFAETDRGICDACPEPKAEKIKKNDREHKREQRKHCDTDQIKRFHSARILSEAQQRAKV